MDESNTAPGKWTLPVHGKRPLATGSEDLCCVCEDLFEKIVWPVQDEDEGGSNGIVSVGWIDRMAATESCVLCQFLVRLFLHNNEVDFEDFDERSRVLCWVHTGCEMFTEDVVRQEWDLSVGFMGNEEVETTGETRSLAQKNFPKLNFNLDVEGLGALGRLERGVKEGEVLYHLGREVQDEVPIELMRKGFETCKDHHGEMCEMPKHVLKRQLAPEEMPDLKFLRVIDVEQKRLVPMPDRGRYVALSYTWSPEPYTSLLKENVRDLEIPGGINIVKLPPTIADAMAVVHMLGERYLWADRVCIIQDDPRDKRIQINRMDVVYRYAALTIVAAGSSLGTLDPGLPGIRPGSRKIEQATARIRGLNFVETNTWLDETIERSRWHSRAWCFQEHLLSKRHLVFTPTRAVFFCGKDTFTEDYVRKACYHTTTSTTEQLGCCCQYVTPLSTDDVHASGIGSSPLAYEIMVRWYTQRNLTVESDILKGVSGLLQTVTRETKQRFLCGMPMKNLLDHFLLWLPRGTSVRRGKNAFGLDFPSWSWAGWVGPATYTVSGEMLDGRETLSFDEETLVEEGYKVLLSTDGDLYHEHDPDEIEDDVLLNLEWCKLCFLAQSAQVQISTTLWGYFSDCESTVLGDFSRCHQILVGSKFAGMLHTHMNKSRTELEDLEASPQEVSEGETRLVELVALSTTHHPWPIYFPHSKYSRDDANFYYEDKDGEQKDHLPFDTHAWDDEDPEMVNVMMIEWHDGLATRAGVGQVHSDAWKLMVPVVREIILG